jgi:hypothetical protein
MDINDDGGVDRRVMRNIRYHALRMAGRRIVAGMEVEDCEQDLVADLIARRKAFDPKLASFRTFADRIVAHRASTLAQPTIRSCAEHQLISLDATPDHEDEGQAPLVEALADSRAPSEEQVAIGIDVRRFVAALPRRLLGTCAILMAGSITDGAREAGISRCTVHERIGTIRRQAHAQGLHHYLARPPDTFCASPVCGGEDARCRCGGLRDRTAMPNKPPRVHLIISEAELHAWIAHAAPGDRIEYHRGVLAADRLVVGSRLPDRDSRQLNRVADILFGLAAAGRVHLLQRRNAAGDYTYIAVAATLANRNGGVAT